MKPQERISYLVHTLEGGNASNFAQKCGLPPASLSRLRQGKTEPTQYYYTKILKGYPSVRRDWLIDGKGEPTKERERETAMMSEIRELRKEVERLAALIKSR